jgi:hypothetical protein
LNEIQEVYRLPGVNSNDKHLGDTKFLPEEVLDKFRIK